MNLRKDHYHFNPRVPEAQIELAALSNRPRHSRPSTVLSTSGTVLSVGQAASYRCGLHRRCGVPRRCLLNIWRRTLGRAGCIVQMRPAQEMRRTQEVLCAGEVRRG